MAEGGETNGLLSAEDIGDNADEIWDCCNKGLKKLRNCCKNASTTTVATSTTAAVVLVAVIAGIIIAVVIVTGTSGEVGTNETSTENVTTSIPTTILFTTNEFTSVDITTLGPDTPTVEVSIMPSTTEKTSEPDTTTVEVSTIPSTTEKTTEPASTVARTTRLSTTEMVPTTIIATTEFTTEAMATELSTTDMKPHTVIATTMETEMVTTVDVTTESGTKTTLPLPTVPTTREMVTTIDVTTERWTRTTLPLPTAQPITTTHVPTTRAISTHAATTFLPTTSILTTLEPDRRYIDIECIRYYVYNDTQTWTSSEQLCENVGAVLASLYTSKISDGVIQFIIDSNMDGGTINYWIGLNDISEEGTFEWLNGDPFGYTDWAPRNPDNWRNQDCGQLWTHRNFQWDDDLCSNQKGYICQSPLNNCIESTTQGFTSEVSTPAATTFLPTTLDPDRRYIDIECIRYYVYNDTQTWASSEQLCENIGAELASLYTSTISDGVIQFIIDRNMDGGTINYWIGLNDISEEGSFEWLNGDPFGYTNWAPRNPDNWRNQDCGQLWTHRNFQWDDDICSNHKGYICQSPLDGCGDTTTIEVTTQAATTFLPTTRDPDRRYIDIGCIRYYVYNDTQTWASSEQLCENVGAELASLYTSEISDGVIQFIIDRNMDGGTINYWIGLNDISEEGSFEWLNGDPFGYTDWAPRNPDNWRNQDCGQLWTHRNYQWDDDICSNQKGYICQSPLDGCGDTTTIEVTTQAATTFLPTTRDPDRRYIDIGCIRYYVYNDTQTWASSEQLCENVGAVLASLYTSTISDSIIQFIIDRNLDDGTISYWIGLNDISEEGSFEWLSGDSFGYTDWAPHNPDNWRNQDCGQLWNEKNFQWDDEICSNLKGYICQRNICIDD